METYFLLDVATVLKLLAIGNAWLVIVIVSHRWKDRNAAPLRYFTAGKSLQAIAWVLLSLRGLIPIEVSAYVGNPLLYLGFSIDIMAFARLVGANIKFEWLLWTISISGGVLLYLIADTPTQLVVISGSTVILIYLTGGCAMLSTPHRSWLQTFTGLTFFSIIIPMAGRIVLAETGNLSLLTGSNLYNSITFMVQASMYVISSAAFVLLMKEADDALLTQSELREHERLLVHQHFMDMLTHELRGALAVIRVASGSIKNMAGSGQQDMLKRLDHINQSVDSVAGILDRCVLLEETNAQGITLLAETSIEKIVTNSRYFLEHPGRFDLNVSGCSNVLADAELLEIMVDNLLDNALKYSQSKSLIALNVQSIAHAGAAYITFSVANEAVAGATSDNKRLFSRYSRGEHAHDITGSGLGLYLIKKMANLQGGDAEKFDSPANRFVVGFWLPAVEN